ncbi:hypothetical protein SeMB42_g03980 [Synchytrium endobioticum]|uniref:Uncharacterized protein n=1 Tax=Synchytrium endobioticum TaxID=286115 RepID=A0A507D1Z0_9FUNG|nr:hypothetical protein SeLEV6574_g06435 [Synchytrium endobioticum]TPX45483.1 hypothetical protein SeMB42_g03980 [Synchytrium endobioticum]
MARFFKSFRLIQQVVSTRIAQFTSVFVSPAPVIVPKIHFAPPSYALPSYALRWLAPSIHQKFAFAALPLRSAPYGGIRKQLMRSCSTAAQHPHPTFHAYRNLYTSPASLIGIYPTGAQLATKRHATSLSVPLEGLIEAIRRSSLPSFKPSAFPTEIEMPIATSTVAAVSASNVRLSMFLTAALDMNLDINRSIKEISREIRSTARLQKTHLYIIAATLEKLDAAGIKPSSYLVQGKEVGVMELLVPLPVSSLEDAHDWLNTNGIHVPSPHYEVELPCVSVSGSFTSSAVESASGTSSSSSSSSSSGTSSISAAREAEVEELLRYLRDLANENRPFDLQKRQH